MRPSAVFLSFLTLAAGTSGCDSLDSSSDACSAAGGCCAASEPSVPGGDAGGVPLDPGGPSPDGSGTVVFAISKLYYGDSDRSGVFSPTAWEGLGLDLDGKSTTRCSTDVCTLTAGASVYAQADGENGIDNSFGLNILPIIVTTFGARGTSTADTALQAGGSTMLIALHGLGANDDASPLSGVVYHAAPSANAPAWNGRDVRDVDTASLVGGDYSAPIVALSGYMAGRTWVGTANDGAALLDLHLGENMMAGPNQPVPLKHVRIVMHVDAGNGTASGVLAGIVAPADLDAWGQQLAGAVSSSLCTGSAFQSIAQQLDESADILLDGTNRAGVACDAQHLARPRLRRRRGQGRQRRHPPSPVEPLRRRGSRRRRRVTTPRPRDPIARGSPR